MCRVVQQRLPVDHLRRRHEASNLATRRRQVQRRQERHFRGGETERGRCVRRCAEIRSDDVERRDKTVLVVSQAPDFRQRERPQRGEPAGLDSNLPPVAGTQLLDPGRWSDLPVSVLAGQDARLSVQASDRVASKDSSVTSEVVHLQLADRAIAQPGLGRVDQPRICCQVGRQEAAASRLADHVEPTKEAASFFRSGVRIQASAGGCKIKPQNCPGQTEVVKISAEIY